MQTPNTPSTPALPLQLCVHRYYSRAEDPAFQQLLVVWNQVAPILAAAPAGTIAKVDSESLFVAPVGGALAMFLSADLTPTAVDGNILRPEDFDGIGADEFAELQSAMERWMAAPTYDMPCTPSHLADVLAANYQEVERHVNGGGRANTRTLPASRSIGRRASVLGRRVTVATP